MAASPTVIPPEYGPTPSQHSVTCTTLPRPGAMLHPKCIAFLRRFRVESRAVGRRPSGAWRLVEDASGGLIDSAIGVASGACMAMSCLSCMPRPSLRQSQATGEADAPSLAAGGECGEPQTARDTARRV